MSNMYSSALYPYPGLRPFHSSEAEIFFGREEQTDDLLRKLSQTRFLGVVGPSGCGKSSLVLAGMIPALEAGFVVKAGSVWEIVTMRPGSHPFAALTEAMLEDDVLSSEWKKNASTIDQAAQKLGATLRRGPRGLIEVLEETPLPQETNLLLIVDQFEELFRLRCKKNTDEQDAFVAMLLETVAQTNLQVYVVITMRSDYLGDCAIFPGLPEALNRSQYLTPRLNRSQREEAITGPSRMFGGDVEPALVNRLLNETGNDPNQLPVLQHLLMRMWSTTKPSKQTDQDNPFNFGIPVEHLGHLLTMEDYEKVGELAEALSRHADQAYDSLNNSQKTVAEVLFRTICERGSAHRDGRHPASVSIIAERAGVATEKVIEIVEIFRNPSFGFLVPPSPQRLSEENIIDISHESLIKLWKRLSKWVEEEAKAADTYRFLEQSAKRWKDGQAALWSTPNLETALLWKEREHPTVEWAERYGGNFKLAMEFLKASQEKKLAEEVANETQRQHELRKARRLLKTSVMAIATGIIAISLFLFLYVIPCHSYSRNFTKRWGVIYPIGALSGSAVKHRSFTIKLKRNGWLNPVQSAEVVDANDQPTPNHGISTYLSDWYKIEKQEKPVRYEFTYDRQGKIVYESAWDRFNRRSWTLVHIPFEQKKTASTKGLFADILEKFRFSVHTSPITSTKVIFVDAEGFPKPQGNSRAEIVKIHYDKHGFETSQKYYDRLRNQQLGPDNAYGVKFIHDVEGRVISSSSLNEQGKPINDDKGNVGLYHKYDAEGNLIEITAYDENGEPTLTRSGWHAVKLSYDKWGNEMEKSYFGLSGEPVVESELFHAHKITCKYDDRGNLTNIKLFDASDNPVTAQPEFFQFPAHEERRTYTVDNKLETHSYLDISKKPLIDKNGWHKAKYEYDEKGFFCAYTTLNSSDTPVVTLQGICRTEFLNDNFGRKIEEKYFDAVHNPVTNAEGYHCKRKKYDRAGNVIKEAYFDTLYRPTSDVTNGAISISRSFDLFGHCQSEQLCDFSGKPLNGKQHFSRVEREYDEFGCMTTERWLDKDNNACKGPSGIHCIKMRYDTHTGLIIEAKNYDTKNQPAENNAGAHIIRYKHKNKRIIETQYDERGRIISLTLLRADSSPNLGRAL